MNIASQHNRKNGLSHYVLALFKRVPWWCIGIVLTLAVLFFVRFFFFDEHIAFRDGAHFYPTLFEYIQTEWLSGHVPLWNPYENIGQPLLANPVCSAFYPGKLVYFLPLPSYLCYHFYVISHLLLAALTCYRLARHWNVSVYAAGTAAVTYAFGGSVLFQYSNVVFLVGAAWLPEAINRADRLLTKRRTTSMVSLGVVISLMVLGGDPQMAYHSVILTLLLLFFYRRNEHHLQTDKHSHLSSEASSVLHLLENSAVSSGSHETIFPEKKVLFSNRLLLVFFALLVGIMLASVQWLPSLEYGYKTDRILEEKPSSVWNSIRVLERGYREHDRRVWDEVRDGVLCREEGQGGITAVRYNNSVGPWQLVEYLWPNASGRLFPTNTYWGAGIRWSNAHFWVPSLYMGILPFLLAVVAFRFRKSDPITLWLSWSCLIFLFGSFGYFGLGWVINQIMVLCGYDAGALKVGNPFGGVYWLFNLILPGYPQFRYPAKLMTITSLMLSLLAARSFDFIFALPHHTDSIHRVNRKYEQRSQKKRLLFLGRLLILVSFVLIPIVLIPQLWLWLGKQIETHPIFGDFLPDRALGEAAFSLIHVINFLFAFFVVVRIFTRAVTSIEKSEQAASLSEQTILHHKYFQRLGLVLLLLTSFDILLSNSWMVATAKKRFFEGKMFLTTIVDFQNAQSPNQSKHFDVKDKKTSFPPRLWRAPTFVLSEHPWLPAEFSSPSPNRLTEWVIWERATLAPHYSQTDHIAIADVRGTVVPADYYAVTCVLRMLWNDPVNNPTQTKHDISLPQYLKSLGVSSMVVPKDRNDADYFPKKDNGEVTSEKFDPITILDTAMWQSFRNQSRSEDGVTVPEFSDVPSVPKESLTQTDKETAEIAGEKTGEITDKNPEASEKQQTELRQWGKNETSVTKLLPSEMKYWAIDAEPRVTIADRVELETPLTFRSRKAFIEKTLSIIERSQRTNIPIVEWESECFSGLSPRFARAFATLVALGENRDRQNEEQQHTEAGTSELISYEPQRVVLEAHLTRPGLLLLRDQYDTNWRAEVQAIPNAENRHFSGRNEGEETDHQKQKSAHPNKMRKHFSPSKSYQVPIFRTNRVLRGVPLPEGDWEVTFTYYPLSFRLGATLSFFSWAALGMFALGIAFRKIDRRKRHRYADYGIKNESRDK